MLPNECEKMSDEWWVMSDENWVTEIEWSFFVGQRGTLLLLRGFFLFFVGKNKIIFVYNFLNDKVVYFK